MFNRNQNFWMCLRILFLHKAGKKVKKQKLLTLSLGKLMYFHSVADLSVNHLNPWLLPCSVHLLRCLSPSSGVKWLQKCSSPRNGGWCPVPAAVARSRLLRRPWQSSRDGHGPRGRHCPAVLPFHCSFWRLRLNSNLIGTNTELLSGQGVRRIVFTHHCVIKIDTWITFLGGCFLRNVFALGKEIVQKMAISCVT